jgi:hypothetical protein
MVKLETNETKWTALKSERHLTSILNLRILLLLLCFLPFFPPMLQPSAHALDEGGATAGFDYRSIDQETFASDTEQYEAVYHLDAWQNVPNAGTFTLWFDWVDGANGDDLHQLGRGFLALQGFKINSFTANALVGDSPMVFTNLPDKFSNVFYPEVYFRGLRTDILSPQGEFHLFGGKVATVNDLLGRVYDTTGEVFYGFRGNYRPLPMLLLGTGFIRTQDEVDNAGNPVTKSNNIFLFDFELVPFPWMKWLTDFRGSYSNGEPGVEDQKDYSLVFGPLIQSGNFEMEVNYRRVGTDYRFVSEGTQGEQDQEGLFLSAEYRPWQDVTFFGNADRFHDNVAEKADRNTTDILHGLLGFSYFNPTYPSVLVTLDALNQETRTDFPAPVNTFTATLFSEVRYQYQTLNPYLRYRSMIFDDKTTRTNQYREGTLTLGLRRDFRAGSFAYLEGEGYQKNYNRDGEDTALSGKLGFNYYHSPSASLWGEVIYSKLNERFDDTRRNRVEGAFGVNYQLPWNIRLYGDVRYSQVIPSQTDALESKGLQFTLRVAKQFGWGKPPEIAGLRPGEGTRGYGTVQGLVFNDVNRNGLQDKEEEGIQNVTVRLGDGSATKTDENGYYRFSRVEVGGHLVTLDVRRIPAEYDIISSDKVRIQVRLRETIKIDFQLIAVGRIEGRIIFDANGNGKTDPDEEGVSDVLVVLEPGDLNTYTNGDGKFTLENVLPGRYAMKSDPTTLPEDAVFTSAEELRFEVPVGGELKDMDFLIFVKPRRIIIGPPTK